MSPHLDVVRVERVWVENGAVCISARTRELPVGCPDCAAVAVRVPSRYVRTLADLAVGGRTVSVGLSVRRLFCDSLDCGRRTFAEQVEGLTVRYQRRSPQLQHLAVMAAVLLAGRGGARLLQILNVPLSRTSVLFHLRRMPPAAMPRVLGVDDFALYADICGTLLSMPTPGSSSHSGRDGTGRLAAGCLASRTFRRRGRLPRRLASIPAGHQRRRTGPQGQRPLSLVARTLQAGRGHCCRASRLPVGRSA
uniref:transposase family protein n=1 Tax=Streptomyces polyasparticus TaxID=2767826 RepID=UPI001BE3DF38|nr:transposase family protein [Streptomyces polyasparticus]